MHISEPRVINSWCKFSINKIILSSLLQRITFFFFFFFFIRPQFHFTEAFLYFSRCTRILFSTLNSTQYKYIAVRRHNRVESIENSQELLAICKPLR
ncbi:hypothetical protein PUN28_017241 [Cardiocondyla obscurior]|uniref:Uncharacterized protein n=1 Tax=Cardiocondyla obscurior TaxID=286306 RepID=A0AAW2ENA7_9HYME